MIATLLVYFNVMIYRMAQSESVQYFQFDKQGNLDIYEPGAGCSDPCVKVGPGF